MPAKPARPSNLSSYCEEAKHGLTDPFVKQLRQQLQGRELKERNRNQRFLTSTGATAPESTAPATERETEADGKGAGAMRVARSEHQNEQLRKVASPLNLQAEVGLGAWADIYVARYITE